VAAIDDVLTEAQQKHPHLGIWISSAGRYRATRRGNVRLTTHAHPGWAMTVDADSLAELETRIKAQEEYKRALFPFQTVAATQRNSGLGKELPRLRAGACRRPVDLSWLEGSGGNPL
jgi:hypothetical protein